MTKRTIGFGVAALVVIALAVGSLQAGHHEKSEEMAGQGEMSQEEMMQAWMEMAAPTEQHEHLSTMAGEWEAHSQYWPTPDAPAQESHGHSKNEVILGGRFLLQEYSGDFMGMEFQGIGLSGYDKVKEKYVGTWADNFGTMIMTMEGEADEHGHIVQWAETKDPFTGQMNKMKMITKVMSPDKHVFEMHSTPPTGGEMYKTMVITYTRVKA